MKRSKRNLRMDLDLGEHGAYARIHFDGIKAQPEMASDILDVMSEKALALGFHVSVRVKRNKKNIFSTCLKPNESTGEHHVDPTA